MLIKFTSQNVNTYLCTHICCVHGNALHALAQPYLLVCVGRDNWADHRSCWDLHRFYSGDRGHRGHRGWDSSYWSPQNFLLKPGGEQTPKFRSSHQFWNAGYIATAPSSLTTSPFPYPPPALKIPLPQDRVKSRAYRSMEAPRFSSSSSGMAFITPSRGPYRAISASISFKRSSPLLPGMPAPGPGTTGPPAPGSPGAGTAPAIAAAVLVAATTVSAQRSQWVLPSTPWLRQDVRLR